MTFVLEDPGGETLDGFLSGSMEMTQFLGFAVGLATALGRLHERELIHKDAKPTNVLVNSATGPWCPGACLPLLGIVVTIAEAGLGILLTLGFSTRMAGVLTGMITLAFAGAMTFVLGVHAPLNYSVFVCSAASFLLASQEPDKLSIDKFRELKSPHKERKENSLAN